MGVSEELARLVAQRDAGDLTPEQFEAAKALLLSHGTREAHGDAAIEVAPDAEAVSNAASRRRRNRRVAFIVAGAIVVGLSVWVIVSESGLTPARFDVRVASLRSESASEVLITISWKNNGSVAGTSNCVLNVNVHDAAGALVASEPSTVETSSAVASGASQRVSIPVYVNVGDAPYVTKSDVSLSDCVAGSS